MSISRSPFLAGAAGAARAAGVAALALAGTVASADCGIFTGVADGNCWNISSYTQDTDRIVGWQVQPDGSYLYVVVENGTNVGQGTFSGGSTDWTSWWTDYIHGVTNDPVPYDPTSGGGGGPSPVPEPQVGWMLSAGLAVLVWASRRRRSV